LSSLDVVNGYRNTRRIKMGLKGKEMTKEKMPKKGYSSPTLETYGTLSEITTQVGPKGAKDHPTKSGNTRA
jgi:hypothetical protein